MAITNTFNLSGQQPVSSPVTSPPSFTFTEEQNASVRLIASMALSSLGPDEDVDDPTQMDIVSMPLETVALMQHNINNLLCLKIARAFLRFRDSLTNQEVAKGIQEQTPGRPYLGKFNGHNLIYVWNDQTHDVEISFGDSYNSNPAPDRFSDKDKHSSYEDISELPVHAAYIKFLKLHTRNSEKQGLQYLIEKGGPNAIENSRNLADAITSYFLYQTYELLTKSQYELLGSNLNYEEMLSLMEEASPEKSGELMGSILKELDEHITSLDIPSHTASTQMVTFEELKADEELAVFRDLACLKIAQELLKIGASITNEEFARQIQRKPSFLGKYHPNYFGVQIPILRGDSLSIGTPILQFRDQYGAPFRPTGEVALTALNVYLSWESGASKTQGIQHLVNQGKVKNSSGLSGALKVYLVSLAHFALTGEDSPYLLSVEKRNDREYQRVLDIMKKTPQKVEGKVVKKVNYIGWALKQLDLLSPPSSAVLSEASLVPVSPLTLNDDEKVQAIIAYLTNCLQVSPEKYMEAAASDPDFIARFARQNIQVSKGSQRNIGIIYGDHRGINAKPEYVFDEEGKKTRVYVCFLDVLNKPPKKSEDSEQRTVKRRRKGTDTFSHERLNRALLTYFLHAAGALAQQPEYKLKTDIPEYNALVKKIYTADFEADDTGGIFEEALTVLTNIRIQLEPVPPASLNTIDKLKVASAFLRECLEIRIENLTEAGSFLKYTKSNIKYISKDYSENVMVHYGDAMASNLDLEIGQETRLFQDFNAHLASLSGSGTDYMNNRMSINRTLMTYFLHQAALIMKSAEYGIEIDDPQFKDLVEQMYTANFLSEDIEGFMGYAITVIDDIIKKLESQQ